MYVCLVYIYPQRLLHTVRPLKYVNFTYIITVYLNVSSAAAFKPIIHIGYYFVFFEKDSSGEIFDCNVFVFDIQQVASACISSLYAYF